MNKKYLLSGDNEFWNQEFINSLKEQIDPSWISLNYQEIELKAEEGVSIKEKLISAINLIREVPLGWGQRVVVIKGELKVEEGEDNDKKTTSKSKSLIEELITTEESNTTVVYVCNPDKRTRIGKLLSSACERVEFLTIPNWRISELAEEVDRISSSQGLKLPKNVSLYIAEAVGNDSRRINEEIAKLITCRGEGTLKPTEVKELIPSIQDSVIQLSQLIKEKETQAIKKLSEKLLESNQPVVITAALTTIFRTWTKIKAGVIAGVRDEEELATQAGVKNPKRLYYLKLEVEGMSLERLIKTTVKLFEIEMNLKRGLNTKILPEKLMGLVAIKD
jgi:DNA polymerase-3 subunit delta